MCSTIQSSAKMLGLLLLSVAQLAAVTAADISVQLARGEVQPACQVWGIEQQNWLNHTYYAFRGIPYAEPPINERRFAAAVPLLTLPAHIDARYDGHDCPSIYATNASENCLTLNVYSSQLQPAQPLPVLVFIHPGGLYIGSGLSSFLGAQYMLSQPLVLVSFNYRLGSLGFLKLKQSNVGFLDQLLVLQWVQQHIARFGGNPQQVTLMGYSAGALCVGLHLVSPLSRQLFHKAIVMSGALPPQAVAQTATSQQRLAVKQANVLGCQLSATASQAELLQCMQRHNGTHIASTLRALFDFGKDNPVYLWLPQVEPPWLPQQYYAALQAGNFSRLPLLIGYTDGEFCSSAAELWQQPQLMQQLQQQFERWAPKIFMYAADEGISRQLRQHYGLLGTSWNFTRVCDLYSDALIRFGAARLARLAAAAQAPVYSYRFAYRGKHSNLAYASPQWGRARVEHMDDLMYLFRMPPYALEPAADAEAAHMINLYVNFIYDFMRTGELRTAAGIQSAYPASYALITDHVELMNGTQFADAAFWEELFPLN